MASCGLNIFKISLDTLMSVSTDEGWHDLSVSMGRDTSFGREYIGVPPPRSPLLKTIVIMNKGTEMYFPSGLIPHNVEQKIGPDLGRGKHFVVNKCY